MADIIEFSKYRQHKSCVAAVPLTPSMFSTEAAFHHAASPCLAASDDAFTLLEVKDLQQVFAAANKSTGPLMLATKQALCNEAMEQAHIEMNCGPIGAPLHITMPTKPAATVAEIQQLKELIDLTRDTLAMYLSHYKRCK